MCDAASARARPGVTVHNIFADDTGESHFRDVEIPHAHVRGAAALSSAIPASAVYVYETAADHDQDWHVAPRRQFVVYLAGAIEITASDGERRVMRAGDIMLAEDTFGRGHRSRSVSAEPRRALFIALSGEVAARPAT